MLSLLGILKDILLIREFSLASHMKNKIHFFLIFALSVNCERSISAQGQFSEKHHLNPQSQSLFSIIILYFNMYVYNIIFIIVYVSVKAVIEAVFL